MSYSEHTKILNQLKVFEAKIPKMVAEMGVIAQNHFIKSFTNQGFTDDVLVKWRPRKRERYKTKSGSIVNDASRGVLIGKGTGNLRKLRRVNEGRYAISIRSNQVTDKYARVHNEGLRAGRGAGFIMPKRQFVGYSHVMNRRIIEMINRNIMSL